VKIGIKLCFVILRNCVVWLLNLLCF
jgi:hypothetical protein